VHDLHVAKLYGPGAIFLLLIAGIGSIFIHVYTQRPPECVSHSVSFKIKIVEIGTNEKPACDFLLIIHSNCICLSCIVSEIHRFINRNLRSFAIFTHPSLVWSPCKGVSVGLVVWKLVTKKLESLGERQTNWRTDAVWTDENVA